MLGTLISWLSNIDVNFFVTNVTAMLSEQDDVISVPKPNVQYCSAFPRQLLYRVKNGKINTWTDQCSYFNSNVTEMPGHLIKKGYWVCTTICALFTEWNCTLVSPLRTHVHNQTKAVVVCTLWHRPINQLATLNIWLSTSIFIWRQCVQYV